MPIGEISITHKVLFKTMAIDLKELIAAGVHFGHQTSRWSPKMKPYIWGHKNKVHLIDVSKTAYQLEKAGRFLSDVAASGKQILFVGTKKSAQEVIRRIGQELNVPFVTHRWIGGTLTNFIQVRKSITKLLHFRDVLSKSDDASYTKKERGRLDKAATRLDNNIGGIIKLRWPVGAIVVVDVRKEQAAVKEAASIGLPIVGIVDTNSDPSLIDYVIPANDDSAKSINVVLSYLAAEITKGKASAAQKISEANAQAEANAEGRTTEQLVAAEEETDEESLAREQAKARKLKESIKARKGDVRTPGRRPRQNTPK